MALQIPNRYLPSLRKILGLSDAAFDELERALKGAPILAQAEAMASHIAPHVPGITADDLNEIVDVIYAVYHVREYSELRADSFLRELIRGLQEKSESKEEINVDKAKERFSRLLDIDALNSLSKAVQLQRDGERLYCGSKIVSDIRPVFGNDVASDPVAAVITHTLKLGYHDSDGHNEFFIVLDQEDLVDLYEIIERAMSKSETLDGLLKRLPLPRLGI